MKQNQAFYEQMFGMKEVGRYSAKGVYDEPIMGYGEGARLALFSPLAEAPIKKSQYPVALIYSSEFDALTKRIEDAKHPLGRLPASQSGTFRIAIVRDPSSRQDLDGIAQNQRGNERRGRSLHGAGFERQWLREIAVSNGVKLGHDAKLARMSADDARAGALKRNRPVVGKEGVAPGLRVASDRGG